MRHLVIGLGEVGSAIQNILECDGIDVHTTNNLCFDAIHICFPYSKKFVENVNHYKKYFEVDLVVVHSTVPVGTCDPEGWVHSPVRGVHPNLEEGIRTFVKYFGGSDARIVSDVFKNKGLKIRVEPLAKTTEALKLWDTTQYGLMILLEKEIHRWCEENEVDPGVVYTHANISYNQGYTELGMSHVVRPHLNHMPGKIGGHCVIQNAELLDSVIAKDIIEINEQLK